MRKCLIGVALAIVGACTAGATVILTAGNVGGQNENVLLNNGTTGTQVQGTVNGQSFFVNFNSSQVLTEPSNGQARVMAATGGLGGLAISLSGGYAYQQIIFNAHIGGTTGNPGSGTISVVSAEPGGAPNQTFTFPLSGGFGNGENFFTLTASGGEAILSTSFSAPNTVTDVRQVRLTGFTQPGQSDIPGGVPEPASMVLLSSALVGIGLLRKRK